MHLPAKHHADGRAHERHDELHDGVHVGGGAECYSAIGECGFVLSGLGEWGRGRGWGWGWGWYVFLSRGQDWFGIYDG